MLFPTVTLPRTVDDRPGPVRRYTRDPDHWRQCAAAARSEAENMNGEKKRLMLRIADDYDRLAERALEAG